MALKLTATTVGDYIPVDPGIYRAEVAGYVEQDPHPEYGERIKFEVTIVEDDPDLNGKKVSGICSTKFSGKSKLRTWVEAVLGRTLADGEEIDFDSLVGMPCMVQVINRKSNDRVFDNIGAVFPSKRRSSSSGNASAPTEAPKRF